MMSATRFSARAEKPETTSNSPPPNSIPASELRRFIISPCKPADGLTLAAMTCCVRPRIVPEMDPSVPKKTPK